MVARGPALRAFWWSPLRSPRLAVGERRNLSAWWHLGVRTRRPFLNFGDELSPLVLSRITGKRVEWAGPASAQVIAIGSILDLAASRGARGLVWGSGLRDPDKAHIVDKSELQLVAVRGHGTRRALGLPDSTPLGDPGLLASAFVRTASLKSSRPALVPHFTQWNSGHARVAMSRFSGIVEMLPPTLPPLDMIARIAAAPLVYSSSLHGVIVAHAVGTPVVLVRPGSGDSAEPGWKYDDYASALGIELPTLSVLDLENRNLRESSGEIARALQDRAFSRAGELGETLARVLNEALD